ncbi:MAG: tyrosine-type recombinase/integrase [Thermoguttaceae bacterium]
MGTNYDEERVREIKDVVERCVVCSETGAKLDRSTFDFLATMTKDLRERFERAGLIEPEADEKLTVDAMLSAYEKREFPRLSESAQENKGNAWKRFFKFFARDVKVAELTKSLARDFADFLDANYSQATRAGTIRDLKRAFNWAKSEELIERNPFDGIPKGSFKNKDREYFVDRDAYARLLDAAPSLEFRVALALWRIGGLRKEEALRLTWSDVNWERGRLLVHSPKTERYKGRETRIIPLFPELREELDALWDVAEPTGRDEPYVIRHNRTTLTQQMERTVFRAGLVRWERLIQNLRSSRAIEVYNEYGALAESVWIGHSVATAQDHYLHLLESDYDKAAFGKTPTQTSKKAKKQPLLKNLKSGCQNG